MVITARTAAERSTDREGSVLLLSIEAEEMIDPCSRCQVEPARGLPAFGEIYALRTAGDRTRHYWLCKQCAKEHALRLDAAGGLFVAGRLPAEAPPINPAADLRLVFRMTESPNHEGGSRIYACRSMD